MLKFSFFKFLIFISISSKLLAALQNEKVLICGVAKNCEEGFEEFIQNVLNLSERVKDYKVIVYENNSKDQTKNLYGSWSKCSNKILFVSEDLPPNFIKNFIPNIGNFRTEFIARARNKVLSLALDINYDDYKYVIMTDLDNPQLWNIEELVKSIENPQYEWDAVFANGAYDIYAFRADECNYGPELLGNKNWMDIYPSYGRFLVQRLKNQTWYKVNSAFGGLAIYKRSSLKGSYYSGLPTSSMLKDLINATYPKDLFFSSFRRSIKNAIQSNKIRLEKWVTDNCNIDSTALTPYGTYDFYICEHVFLHYLMKKNGYDRLFINPNLILRSKEHNNFD